MIYPIRVFDIAEEISRGTFIEFSMQYGFLFAWFFFFSPFFSLAITNEVEYQRLHNTLIWWKKNTPFNSSPFSPGLLVLATRGLHTKSIQQIFEIPSHMNVCTWRWWVLIAYEHQWHYIQLMLATVICVIIFIKPLNEWINLVLS